MVQGLSASERGRLLDVTARRRTADVVVLVPMVHRTVMVEFAQHGLPVVVAASPVSGRASVGIDDFDVQELTRADVSSVEPG